MKVSKKQLLPSPKLKNQGSEKMANVGCPQCGSVFTIFLKKKQSPPLCAHNGSYFRRADDQKSAYSLSDKEMADAGWTEMVRIKAFTEQS